MNLKIGCIAGKTSDPWTRYHVSERQKVKWWGHILRDWDIFQYFKDWDMFQYFNGLIVLLLHWVTKVCLSYSVKVFSDPCSTLQTYKEDYVLIIVFDDRRWAVLSKQGNNTICEEPLNARWTFVCRTSFNTKSIIVNASISFCQQRFTTNPPARLFFLFSWTNASFNFILMEIFFLYDMD